MTALRRYLLGLTLVAAFGTIVIGLAGPQLRTEIGLGELIGLAIQAPLGWWTVRSIGTERFQLVWLGGMVIRLAVVALAALLLAATEWDAAPVLMALVATLLVLLLVEAATAVQEHSRSKS